MSEDSEQGGPPSSAQQSQPESSSGSEGHAIVPGAPHGVHCSGCRAQRLYRFFRSSNNDLLKEPVSPARTVPGITAKPNVRIIIFVRFFTNKNTLHGWCRV